MIVRSAPSRGRHRVLWGIGAAGVLALLGLAAGALLWSGATLGADAAALARVEVQPFGGTLETAQAFGPDGRRIPLSIRGGRLTPQAMLTPGERVSIEVVIRRPGWLAWLLGKERRERLTLRLPVAELTGRWLTVPRGSSVQVEFEHPVAAVAYAARGIPARRELPGARRSISLGRRAPAGSLEVAAAARSWERLGPPALVSWFPSRSPVVIGSPAPGARITPVTPLRLTFSRPLDDVLGAAQPKLLPRAPGRWHRIDTHTLLFLPSGLGAPLATELKVTLPHEVAVVARSGHGLRATRTIHWTVPPGSPLRLQQLLADAGYLPLDWQPVGDPVARAPQTEELAAIDPPAGRFTWRYPNVPPELVRLWSVAQPNQITRGAVMMFQHDHELAVDGVAGPHVWRALLSDAIAGRRRTDGYSFVYVHRNLPQSLNLWHNGRTILSSPGNTGVPAAPTQLGTFPVFEHIPVGTMSGRNPDGTRYHDPGVRYISYFNGGDAIHAFNRSSFGTPQSLGCVELPLDAAAKVWPYTPIGTLVTVEN
jgi:L,D-transpeptidase-like protein/putative peptidoglycan binding protein